MEYEESTPSMYADEYADEYGYGIPEYNHRSIRNRIGFKFNDGECLLVQSWTGFCDSGAITEDIHDEMIEMTHELRDCPIPNEFIQREIRDFSLAH